VPPVFWKSPSRKKAYEKLPLTPAEREEADRAIQALGSNPRPDGCKKLSGKLEGVYRITVCRSFRVLYRITAEEILIEDVGDRKEAYR
jgi:mRNA-degrading endonuclease RelE of RelBE toxin-antitoxin system